MKDLVAIAEKIAAKLIERRQTIAIAEILDRRPDLRITARSARRVRLFSWLCGGLYARRAADSHGHTR